jgi:hypothetical protein
MTLVRWSCLFEGGNAGRKKLDTPLKSINMNSEIVIASAIIAFIADAAADAAGGRGGITRAGAS